MHGVLALSAPASAVRQQVRTLIAVVLWLFVSAIAVLHGADLNGEIEKMWPTSTAVAEDAEEGEAAETLWVAVGKEIWRLLYQPGRSPIMARHVNLLERTAMKLPRPTLSGIIAILALCVATSGTAYAAVALPKNSVGAKQIRTDAVRGAEIKNGAVRMKDLSAPVRGALADRAPTAYQKSNGTIQFIDGVYRSFATMDIPEAGDYLITANLRVFPRVGNPGDNLYCNIAGGGGSISIVNQGVDTSAGVGQVTMHGIKSVSSPTTLDLQCRAATNEITMTYDWTAVQVHLN